jgi:membrane protein required for colicin V production
LQPLDIILAVPLIWALWVGWKRGLLVELVNTAGLIVAVFCGFMLLDTVLLLLRPVFGPGFWLPILTFFLIVGGVFYSVRMLAIYTRKVLRQTLLGDADSFAGAVVSFVKISLSISTFLWLLAVLNLKIPQRHTQDTFIYPALSKAGPGFMKGVLVIAPGLRVIPNWIEKTLNPAAYAQKQASGQDAR